MIRQNEWLVNCFKDQDVFVIGSGPSLTDFDYRPLRDKKKIVINHQYRYVTPDIHLFLDGRFVSEVKKHFGHDVYNFPWKVLAGPASGMTRKENVYIFQSAEEPSQSPQRLYTITQSGLCAINAAILTGAARIFLLGMDCRFVGDRGHSYSHEFRHIRDGRQHEKAYAKNIKRYRRFSEHKHIWNLSPISAIDAFPKMQLSEALAS